MRLEDYLNERHAAGQCRAAPLHLRCEKGGYNCLHRDLYSERLLPLQVIALLKQPQEDFAGGELLLIEQWSRMSLIGRAVYLERDAAAIITSRYGH